MVQSWVRWYWCVGGLVLHSVFLHYIQRNGYSHSPPPVRLMLSQISQQLLNSLIRGSDRLYLGMAWS